MQIKQEQRQESDATVKKVEEDRGLSTQVTKYNCYSFRYRVETRNDLISIFNTILSPLKHTHTPKHARCTYPIL